MNAQTAADQFYRQAAVPFKDRLIAQAATTDEPDTIWQSFMKAGRGDKAQKFYNALDPKGQAAVQYELLTQGINQASDAAKGFNAGKFAQYMDRMAGTPENPGAAGIFFQGPDRWAWDGRKNLAIHAAKVQALPFGKAAATVAGLTEGAHMMGAPGAIPVGGAVASIAGLSKLLLQSDWGKALLYRMSATRPGTAMMDGLVKMARNSATNAGLRGLRVAGPPAVAVSQANRDTAP